MMVRTITVATFVFLLSGCIKAQNFQTFFGEWKVEKCIAFQRVSGETVQEYSDRMESEKECLKSTFIIDSNGIRNVSHACNFFSCEMQYLRPQREIVKVVEDNEYTREAMGNEMVDSNIIGRNFVDLLDKNYHQKILFIYTTGCMVDYGDFTLKICIVNQDKIALYQDYNLIILNRK